MRISFCLPNPSIKPVGGYKIVFEYANRLCDRGHDVSIIFARKAMFDNNKLIPNLTRNHLGNLIVKIYPRWFILNKRIRKIFSSNLSSLDIPDNDVIISTAIETVDDVFNLPEGKGKKVMFIQDFENWAFSDEKVLDTYKNDVEKIVISNWLKEIVDKHSTKESLYIPNGIDFNDFGIDRSVEQRNPYSVSMLYHSHERKGAKYGLEVLLKLKEKYPNLEATLFGAPKRPLNLPNWIKYVQKANKKQLRSIYNNSSVFLSTSIKEGFGLTGAEAMACGCALVSTSHQGVFEYATNNVNALISPVKDVNHLFENVSMLIDNELLRKKIATNGNVEIQKLNWTNSVNSFEKFLMNLSEINL